MSYPVIINNRNRLTTLKVLVRWLESVGTQDIIIIDNNSSYEPLLDYYRKSPHKIIRLKDNVGYLAFWELGIWEVFRNSFYAYTDSDVLPDSNCPRDYLDIFREGLNEFKNVGKVGFSLKIDDLPDYYIGKSKVINHESVFWKKKVHKLFYEAPIDTTFALYRPSSRGGYWIPALRSESPYIARHLPWYVDSLNLSLEEKFYRENANSNSSWTEIDNTILDDVKNKSK